MLEEVTVTGSRIKRKDLTSSSPLVTIDAAQLESHASLSIDSYLNQLPQYNVAQSAVTEPNDVQPSAVNTVGIADVSLRGLGPNRGLVLIDGHRTTPANLLMVTDVNTIPEAMIDHVEIITGGASAVYGADAMAGVTNFVTKKNYEGAQLDVQDSITQAGDGNETRVSGIIGSKIADGKGNIIMGLEYYNRNPAFAINRSFYTDNWTDPNATLPSTLSLFTQGYNGYEVPIASAPSTAAMNALFPAAAASGKSGVCTYASECILNTFQFMPNGTVSAFNNLPVGQSGYTGNYTDPLTNGGYGVVNALDPYYANNQTNPAPPEIQELRWNNPYTQISIPQTRYSFFSNGTYDVTDNVQFYMTSRFADSLTTTQLATPTTAIFGWEASVPFNAATDSPINPADITSSTSQSTLSAIVAAFEKNPNCASVSCNPYWNPGFIAPNTKGAEHPVPWSLAMLLLSRQLTPGSNGVPPAVQFGGLTSTFFGGPVTCNNSVSAAINADCVGGINYTAASPATGGQNASSWILSYLPQDTAPQRTTVDNDESFQITTGFKFPLWADWTGDVYYSRGETLDYEQGLGNLSLERFRSVIDAPDYGGNGDLFQGNQQGASTGFGTSVPSQCTSGMYGTIFDASVAPSANCENTIGSVLQTLTAV
ncbi:MAG TPA: TonB-dependent receptor plug domain-containing protein [Steroidobacteraceae bacterium]|nr:TonB-dependent receptor plug domain-containing protein [Steroidobacteraceae bacterium]